jgi:ADP-ribose pyrophosphatase
MSYSLIEKQVLYNGRKIRLELHRIQDENGRQAQREVCVHNGAVVVLPFLDARTILLIRNHRYVISQVLLELPAGTLEKNEPPMNCAGRELQEETGYLARRLRLIGSFYTSPGVLTEKIHAFGAYDLTKTQAAPDEGEEIEVVPTPLTEALDMIGGGQIVDAKTIATLLMYERFAPSPHG